jgi:hypothetical protein
MVVDQSFARMIDGFDQGFESQAGAGSFSCKPRKTNVISMNGYFGREYDLSTCTVPGIARVFTSVDVVAGTRKVYFALAIYRSGGAESALAFIKSVKVGTPAAKAPVPPKTK